MPSHRKKHTHFLSIEVNCCLICITHSGLYHTKKHTNSSSHSSKVRNRKTEVMRLCISCKVASAVYVCKYVSSFLTRLSLTSHSRSFLSTQYSLRYSRNAPAFTESVIRCQVKRTKPLDSILSYMNPVNTFVAVL